LPDRRETRETEFSERKVFVGGIPFSFGYRSLADTLSICDIGLPFAWSRKSTDFSLGHQTASFRWGEEKLALPRTISNQEW
jgi:hypothetical protein